MTDRRFCLAISLSILVLLAGCSSDDTPSNETPASQPVASHGADDAEAKPANNTDTPKQRHFVFTYAGTINQLPPESVARVWLPVPSNSFGQSVKTTRTELPAAHRETTEGRFGNKLIYFEAQANEQGEIPFLVEYEIERHEIVRGQGELEISDNQDQFLAPAQLIPLDVRLLTSLFPDGKPQGDKLTLARRLYEAVDDHLRYEKPPGGEWGRGDALWACDSGFGNCTDFHSLFISAARQLQIPARFEIGFPLAPKRGSGSVPGYHCWAQFLEGNRWSPVDISEADKQPQLRDYFFGNITENRVTFSIGRDLELEPATSQPVNYLVYPHVEVEGKLHTAFEEGFAYRDL